jgi:acyl-CoA thioester hydrolase
MATTKRPLQVERRIAVQTYDIDFAQIVHNIVYIRWLEDLRLQLLAETMPMESLLALGISPILTKTEIEYRLPVRLGDRPLGRMWVSELGRTRWTVQAEIVVEERLAAVATQQGYFTQIETQRPVRVPAALRQMWEAAS